MHPFINRLQQTRFTHLLIALAMLLFVSPFAVIISAQVGRALASLLIVILLILVLVASALAVSEHRRHAKTALVLAAVCTLLIITSQVFDSSTLLTCQYVVTIAFLGYVILLIIRALFQRRVADYDTIAASVCGYVLIGVAFAIVYSLTLQLDDTAIAVGRIDPARAALNFSGEYTATSLYFSFVTLTTLGFGDITPVSMPARMLTTTEALIGQLYLVVLVARLVGLHIANESATADAGNTEQELSEM